jgi:outer membrane protein TolC
MDRPDPAPARSAEQPLSPPTPDAAPLAPGLDQGDPAAVRFTGNLNPVDEAIVPQPTPTSIPPCDADTEVLPIDLPTALRLVNSANPTVAVARVRVQEAFFRQRQAEVLWLPNLQDGPAYNRHDGLLQTSIGNIVEVNKWNLFYGDGAVMSFQLADALFLPLVARQLTRAEAARARTVTDNVQLDVALTYLDLLQVYGQLAVNAEALAYAEEMLRFALVGRRAELGKTPADTTRARAEVELRRKERIDVEGRVGELSARLAQLLLLRPTVDLRPAEPAIMPIALVPIEGPLKELVATGLRNRPELAESRALVGAALESWRQARITPLLPRIDVSYLAGEFGGGTNDSTTHFRSRGDGFIQATWELHNLGFGDRFRAQEGRARYRESNLHVVEVQAQVAAEVTAAAKDARARQRSLASAQNAVRQAEETWKRLYGGAFGMNTRERRYDPLEPLIAEQQVATARTVYLQNVIEFNKAQFRLYAAMGCPPLEALPNSTALPVEVPVEPPAPQFGQPLELKPPDTK